MENPYIDYYLKQAGSGITGYSGSRYHVGNGFFGKILKNLKPALKYIGRQGWDAIKSMSSDVINGGNIVDAGRNALVKTTQNVLNDASDKLSQYKKRKQTGGGKRKRRVNTKKHKKRPKTVLKKVTKKPKPKRKVYKKRKTTKKVKKSMSFF